MEAIDQSVDPVRESEWTTISIARSQQPLQNPIRCNQNQSKSQGSSIFTRTTGLGHTILNSPTSTCRLHVVSLLNRSLSTPAATTDRISLSDDDNANEFDDLHKRASLFSSNPARKSSELFERQNQQQIQNIPSHKSPLLSTVSSPKSNDSSSCLSCSNKNCSCNTTLISILRNNQHNNNNLCKNWSKESKQKRKRMKRYLQHQPQTSSASFSSVTSSLQSSAQTTSTIPLTNVTSNVDWLKYGFKLLLMFTVLFWLFSIVTWMSLMPKTMPISLTIITSMMTIGLIISLVIQSEWPYSFEFIPNGEVDNETNERLSDDDVNVLDDFQNSLAINIDNDNDHLHFVNESNEFDDSILFVV